MVRPIAALEGFVQSFVDLLGPVLFGGSGGLCFGFSGL